MNPNGKDFQLVAADFRGRAVDSLGQQVYKGGQTVNSGIIQSITSSYSLLVFHPVASIMLVLGVFILVAEFYATAGPLEYMANALLSVVKDPDSTQVAKTASSLASVVVLHAIDWKISVAKICLIWYTYVVKPSGRHVIIAVVLTVSVFLMQITYIKLFVISQVFFLFACVRSPFWKVVFFMFGVIFLYTNFFEFTKVIRHLEDAHRKFNRTI